MPVQIPIDFGQEPGYAPEDFLVAPCNALAHGWVARWPDWRAPTLALVGPSGCGKTHLAHLFACKSGAAVIPAAALTLADPPRLAEAGAVVVEDADLGVDEQALFHLYNLCLQVRAGLLLTAREAPARWRIGLPDLRSRLATIQIADIGAPDDELLRLLLVKLFSDRQLRVGEDVVTYLTLRIERSFEAARRVVGALDAAALAGQRAVSVPLAREVLGQLCSQPE